MDSLTLHLGKMKGVCPSPLQKFANFRIFAFPQNSLQVLPAIEKKLLDLLQILLEVETGESHETFLQEIALMFLASLKFPKSILYFI